MKNQTAKIKLAFFMLMTSLACSSHGMQRPSLFLFQNTSILGRIFDALLRSAMGVEIDEQGWAAQRAQREQRRRLSQALVNAANDGNREIVEQLLTAGAPADARNDFGWTALQRAAVWGRLDIVALLLQNGAFVDAPFVDAPRAFVDDPNPLDNQTPLHMVAISRDLAGAALLLQNGASLNARNGTGQTPLHSASASPFVMRASNTIALLLQNGASVDNLDAQGRTPLQEAALGYDDAIVDILQDAQFAPELTRANLQAE